ncbi:MAG: DUF349 domain-containing protein [Bacteroidota bacterium]
MKSEIISKMEELLASADISAVATRIKNIQREYEQLFQKGLEKARQDFIDQGGKARDFIYSKSEEDDKIIQLLEKFRNLKKESDLKLADEQKKNLHAKREIIKEINDLTQLSTNVGIAIKKLTELQGKWKEIGAVSPHDYKNLQAEYSKAVENFNYNLSIYRALQEHDLKKNEELKLAIIEKVKQLSENESIKDIERLVKLYRNEWEEVGPVQNDRWEGIKNEYRVSLENAYSRIKQHYKDLEEESEKNLNAKKDIVERAKVISNMEITTEEDWQKKTDEIIALQNEWKTTGRADKKKSDLIWAELRNFCDSFFDKKKNYYTELKEKYSKGREEKMKLIEEAEKLHQSTDWKNTSEKFIHLQNRWKKTSSVSQNEEHRLFARFRKACNNFFEAKRAHHEAIDQQYDGNLKIKEEIISRLDSFSLSGDVPSDKASLKSFVEEWRSAGLVPFKDKQRVNEAFYGKVDQLFEHMNISAEEKAWDRFNNKIERLTGADNAEQLLIKESDFLRKQADEINKNINNYENNLGFFKHAKTKNPIMIETEQKILIEKSKLEHIKKKQGHVREQIRKLKESLQSSSK